MNKVEALQIIVEYEKAFTELKGSSSIPLDLFRKYNDAKYLLSVEAVKYER